MTQLAMAAGGRAVATPSRRKPFYKDLSLQVFAGMVVGVIFGAVWPNAG